jgi:hypothetical protein
VTSGAIPGEDGSPLPGRGARSPLVDEGISDVGDTEKRDIPRLPGTAGHKPEREPKGAGHGPASGIRAPLLVPSDLPGVPTQRQFNDALGELMAPRATPEVIETLRAGVEHRIRGAILEQAAHLQLQLPSGDLGVHVQLRDGLADVRLDGAVAESFRGRETELRSALAAKGIEVGEVRTSVKDAVALPPGAALEAALRPPAPEPVRAPAPVAAIAETFFQGKGTEPRARTAAGATDLTALQALAGRRSEAAGPFDPARAVSAVEAARQTLWETEAGRPPVPVAMAVAEAPPSETVRQERTDAVGVGVSGDQNGAQGGGDGAHADDERFPAGRDGTVSATVPVDPAPRRPGQRSAVHIEA